MSTKEEKTKEEKQAYSEKIFSRETYSWRCTSKQRSHTNTCSG